MNERTLVLDTLNPLAMQMADDALLESGIPHAIVEFTKSGRSMEMPRAPSPGRGYRWQITVPAAHLSDAEAVLMLLPTEVASSIETTGILPMSAKAKRWRVYYRVFLVAAIVGLALLFYLFCRV